VGAADDVVPQPWSAGVAVEEATVIFVIVYNQGVQPIE